MGTSKGNKKRKIQKTQDINPKETTDNKLYSFGILTAVATIPGILGSIALNNHNYILSYIAFIATSLMIIGDSYLYYRRLKWKLASTISIIMGFVVLLLLTLLFNPFQENDRVQSLKETNSSNQRDTVEKIYTYTKYLQLQPKSVDTQQTYTENKSHETETTNIDFLDKKIGNFGSILGESTWLNKAETTYTYAPYLINTSGLSLNAPIDYSILRKTFFDNKLDSITEGILNESRLKTNTFYNYISSYPTIPSLNDSVSSKDVYDFQHILKKNEINKINLSEILANDKQENFKITEEPTLKLHFNPEVNHQKIKSDLDKYKYCIEVTIAPQISFSKNITLNFDSDIEYFSTQPPIDVTQSGHSISLAKNFFTITIKVYSNKQIELLDFE